MRALIVDDSDTVLRFFGDYMRDMGHEVSVFREAETALNSCLDNDYEIALLDWMLPGMSGLELCRRMRLLAEGDRCVILIITAKSRIGDLDEVLESGADDYVVKPVSEGLFRTRIRIAEKVRLRKCEALDATAALRKARYGLEKRVLERTMELEEANALLTASLDEKKVLLREIHHRVKNNMAIISAFLDLQSMMLGDKSAAKAFRGCRQRIKSMALVHEALFSSRDLKNPDVREYIDQLLDEITGSLCGMNRKVDISEDIEPVRMDIDHMVPFGLIVNEAVTNSLMHAFKGDEDRPAISISLAGEGEGRARLEIADNGSGLPADEDLENGKTLGMRIIKALVEQMDGSLDIERAEGTRYSISFPLGDIQH